MIIQVITLHDLAGIIVIKTLSCTRFTPGNGYQGITVITYITFKKSAKIV